MGRNSLLQNVEIGNYCSISEGCLLGLPAHPTSMVSTSPVFLNGKNVLKKNFAQIPFEDTPKTIIGSDVWIGANVLVKAGIKIGNGVVIGAGAVVVKDVPPFSIVGGVPAEKITVIYNWGYSDKVVDIPWEENKFVKKYELNKQIFYAVYAGNIGKMQNVELVVDAAKELQNDDRIRFLIIGDGARREEIKKRAEGVRNIQLFPLQPSEIAIHIYSAAGVNIIPLVEGGPKTAMPSKTGVVLSCGKPVIFAFGKECEFARIVHKYNAGSCVSASNASELARAVKECSENKSENGTQQLFADMFTKTDGVERYVNAISAH